MPAKCLYISHAECFITFDWMQPAEWSEPDARPCHEQDPTNPRTMQQRGRARHGLCSPNARSLVHHIERLEQRSSASMRTVERG